MKKRSTNRSNPETKEKEVLSNDPIANMISGNILSNADFQDGFVYFAPNQRFFGSFVIGESETPSGRGYVIQRTGTKVDIKDVEYLKSIKKSVFCRNEGRYLDISPVGETRI